MVAQRPSRSCDCCSDFCFKKTLSSIRAFCHKSGITSHLIPDFQPLIFSCHFQDNARRKLKQRNDGLHRRRRHERITMCHQQEGSHRPFLAVQSPGRPRPQARSGLPVPERPSPPRQGIGRGAHGRPVRPALPPPVPPVSRESKKEKEGSPVPQRACSALGQVAKCRTELTTKMTSIVILQYIDCILSLIHI